MKKRSVSLGVIGCGTVGGSFIRAVVKKKKYLRDKTGISFTVTSIYDKDRSRKALFPSLPFAKSAEAIIEDPLIDIVVELIGGINPSYGFTKRSFENGKSVVNANKALLCEKGRELLGLAEECEVYLGFEAAVAGAIPVVKTINESFAGNRLSRILGILNGTTNYILSEMTERGANFERALEKAQKAGYAEADPALDISGWDTAHKISILSFLAFNKFIPSCDLYVEGIADMEQIDIKFAQELGYRVKLLAVARNMKNQLELRVHPALLPEKHLLSTVEGVNNAVYIEGDMIGKAMLYGEGAGGAAAASAVLSDVIDIAQRISCRDYCPGNSFCDSRVVLVPAQEITARYYFRFTAVDKPGVLAQISKLLGNNGISVASLIQKEESPEKAVPLVMITHRAKEKNMLRAVKEIDKLDIIKKPTKTIRIEE